MLPQEGLWQPCGKSYISRPYGPVRRIGWCGNHTGTPGGTLARAHNLREYVCARAVVAGQIPCHSVATVYTCHSHRCDVILNVPSGRFGGLMSRVWPPENCQTFSKILNVDNFSKRILDVTERLRIFDNFPNICKYPSDGGRGFTYIKKY